MNECSFHVRRYLLTKIVGRLRPHRTALAVAQDAPDAHPDPARRVPGISRSRSGIIGRTSTSR